MSCAAVWTRSNPGRQEQPVGRHTLQARRSARPNGRDPEVALALALLLIASAPVGAQVAVRAKVIHTMAGPPVADGVVVIRNGKIAEVGPIDRFAVPESFRVLDAAVVTPGLIDAHTVVGLSGILNYAHDQDQIEHSTAVQPELRAIDAYNPDERLVKWVRGFGVTTIHTGHAPGELISGQTMIAKTAGRTVADALMVDAAAIAATLGPSAFKDKDQSPGTRGKEMAMLRAEFIKAAEYLATRNSADQDKRPGRDLKLEALGRILNRELPLLVTANRAQDIASALRLAAEFKIRIVLDSAAEAYLLIDEIKAADVPVILHPTMMRATGEAENLSFETAAKLRQAGILVALQSGCESYVPKTRVVLFEAAVAAANGLSFEEALATITIDAARLLGVVDRVGSIETGKDGDLALFDGDPFEYTTHCTGVVICGEVVSEETR
jgi:imidazolonepropionase-like amidohydrolase